MNTFSIECLRAIAHLSKSMQDRIIADVTRFMLTGETPEKLPPMRKALFISLVLQLNPEADLKALINAVNNPKDPKDLNDPKAVTLPAALPPVVFSEYSTPPMSPAKLTRAERRRFMRTLGSTKRDHPALCRTVS